MKKIKTVKGKIVAGAIAISLVGSGTFAFASTNAGTQFTAWGQAQIDAAKAAVSEFIDGERPGALDGVKAYANGERDESEERIDTAGEKEKEQTEKAITKKLKEHIASLNAAYKEFMQSIGADFDLLVASENGETSTSLNTLHSELNTNINAVLTAAKERNVNDVTEKSLLVKGQATSDLIQKINQVKSDLQSRIDKEEATALGEVEQHMIKEVKRIKGLLDNQISTLEQTAKDEIAAAGQAVEDSAIANFQRVISLTQTETPIEVDEQKLDWVAEKRADGSVTFTVTNENEFDVVFRYTFLSDDGFEQGGVSETAFAEGSAKPGVTTLVFDTETLNLWGFKIDVGGILGVQYLDENGEFQYGAEIGLY